MKKTILLWLACQALIQATLAGDLLIIPTPDASNQVTATIDELFFMTCQSTGNANEKPKALQWIGPDGNVIKSDANMPMYTMLEGDVLQLFFSKLKPRDTGLYKCTGIEASFTKEKSITLVLQKKITFFETEKEQFIKGMSFLNGQNTYNIITDLFFYMIKYTFLLRK